MAHIIAVVIARILLALCPALFMACCYWAMTSPMVLDLYPLKALTYIGCIGNIVLIALWDLQKSPELIYVLAKTMADIVYLVFKEDFFDGSAISYGVCTAQDTLMLGGRHADTIVMCLLIVERFLAIMCPEEYEQSAKTNRWQIIGAFTLPLLFCDFLMTFFSMEPAVTTAADASKCVRVYNALRDFVYFCSFMLNLFLPALLFLLLNALIVVKANYASDTHFVQKIDDLTATGQQRMASAIPLLFPLLFLLLNMPTYVLLFAYPPHIVRRQVNTFGRVEPAGLQQMLTVTNSMNLCNFISNLPAYVMIKAFERGFKKVE